MGGLEHKAILPNLIYIAKVTGDKIPFFFFFHENWQVYNKIPMLVQIAKKTNMNMKETIK